MYKSISLIALTLAVGCAATGAPGASLPNDFTELVQLADQTARRNVLLAEPHAYPLVGRDFNLLAADSKTGITAEYGFAASPCLSPDAVRAALAPLGYIEQPKGEPTNHGVPRQKSIYRLTDTDGSRSIGAWFDPRSDYECLETLFVDFSRKEAA